MANYKLVHSEPAPRVELHEALGLTGAEVSINTVPPNGGVPFVHVHTNNEELYIVLEGKGELWIDGETLPIKAGDSFRLASARSAPRRIPLSNTSASRRRLTASAASR